MTIATVITAGYGKFGSIHLMPTLGYGFGNTTIASGPLRGYGFQSEKVARSGGTAWNPNWSEDYGPDYAKAKSAEREEIEAAIEEIAEAEHTPPQMEDTKEKVHSMPRRDLAAVLMREDQYEYRITFMLEYYAFLRWRCQDEEDIAVILLLI